MIQFFKSLLPEKQQLINLNPHPPNYEALIRVVNIFMVMSYISSMQFVNYLMISATLLKCSNPHPLFGICLHGSVGLGLKPMFGDLESASNNMHGRFPRFPNHGHGFSGGGTHSLHNMHGQFPHVGHGRNMRQTRPTSELGLGHILSSLLNPFSGSGSGGAGSNSRPTNHRGEGGLGGGLLSSLRRPSGGSDRDSLELIVQLLADRSRLLELLQQRRNNTTHLTNFGSLSGTTGSGLGGTGPGLGGHLGGTGPGLGGHLGGTGPGLGGHLGGTGPGLGGHLGGTGPGLGGHLGGTGPGLGGHLGGTGPGIGEHLGGTGPGLGGPLGTTGSGLGGHFGSSGSGLEGHLSTTGPTSGGHGSHSLHDGSGLSGLLGSGHSNHHQPSSHQGHLFRDVANDVEHDPIQDDHHLIHDHPVGARVPGSDPSLIHHHQHDIPQQYIQDINEQPPIRSQHLQPSVTPGQEFDAMNQLNYHANRESTQQEFNAHQPNFNNPEPERSPRYPAPVLHQLYLRPEYFHNSENTSPLSAPQRQFYPEMSQLPSGPERSPNSYPFDNEGRGPETGHNLNLKPQLGPPVIGHQGHYRNRPHSNSIDSSPTGLDSSQLQPAESKFLTKQPKTWHNSTTNDINRTLERRNDGGNKTLIIVEGQQVAIPKFRPIQI